MAPEKCRGKVKYDKKGAISAKNLRFKQDHVALRVYECDLCGRWHLTSSSPHRKEWHKKK